MARTFARRRGELSSYPDGMLEFVRDRRSSPVLVGRGVQLETLGAALADVLGDETRAVFIGGEAGIGKTRLVEEFAPRARQSGARVLVGQCLELGPEGLPYAPFVTALRGLVRDEGADAVTSLVPAGPMGRLLPDLAPSGRHDDREEPDERTRLYEHVLLLLEGLARQRPLTLIIEDAHWADRSTHELLVFLVHNLRAAPVLLLVTFRSDELHRKHPLRPLLSELDRVRAVERHELPRLEQREVAEQAAAILGGATDTALVDDLYARTEGNPLFVEALLDCPAPGACGMSDSLRDLLLRVVEELPEDTRHVLRLASTSGLHAPHAELAAVSDLSDTALAAALRPAVENQVLLLEGDGYRFRHALIREAVHEELLPGEHTRMHVRFAEAIEGERSSLPDVRRLVAVAHHWHAAHDIGCAVPAAWRAAREAARSYAHAERLGLLERVLELWDRLPGAADLIGVSHTGVLEEATDAAEKSGEVSRGVTYASAALDEIDRGPEPLRAASLLQSRGRMHRNLGREGSTEDFREAVRLTEGDTAGLARAKALGTLAQTLMTELADDEAAVLADEALQLARGASDLPAQVHNLNTLAVIQAHRGDKTGALEGFAQARRLAEGTGHSGSLVRLGVNESDVLEAFGDHERALEVARAGVSTAEAVGAGRTKGAFLAINIVDPLAALGRWEEAETTALSALALDPPPAYAAFLTRWRAELALARGDIEGADRLAAHARELGARSSHEAQLSQPLARVEADICTARRRPDDALDRVEDVMLDVRQARHGWRYRWPLLVAGARAGADALETATHLRDEAMAEHTETNLARLDRRAAEMTLVGPVDAAHQATFDAERGRARHRSIGAWERATEAWAALRQPYDRAYALFRLAEAGVGSGQGDPEAALREAHAIATQLGATLLLRDIDALGSRTRISLSSEGGGDVPAESVGRDDAAARSGVSSTEKSTGDRLGLTSREAEVLRLLAYGHSNRQIAGKLYISPKTASVHVSNILAKLGVSSRVEAAGVAHRLGLVETPTLAERHRQ